MNRNLPMIPTTAHLVEQVYQAVDDRRVRLLLDDPEYVKWLRATERREPMCERAFDEAYRLAYKEGYNA